MRVDDEKNTSPTPSAAAPSRIASPLGLYAEELDAETGYHPGNFAHAFSHLALIDAAVRIAVPELLVQY